MDVYALKGTSSAERWAGVGFNFVEGPSLPAGKRTLCATYVRSVSPSDLTTEPANCSTESSLCTLPLWQQHKALTNFCSSSSL
eukprot:scaffold2984_cov452-Prasinococcus_capsulatus_cf.AAC.5